MPRLTTVYASCYVLESNSANFNASTYKVTGVHSNNAQVFDGNVYYDPDTVTFIIASGIGSTFDTVSYTGVSGLLNGMSDKFPVSNVSLENIAFTGHFDAQGTFYADVIFAFEGTALNSGIMFFPDNVSADPTGMPGYYSFTGGYINGTESELSILRNTNAQIIRGFYSFTYDVDSNLYNLTALNRINDYEYSKVTVRQVGSKTYIDPTDPPSRERDVASEYVIIDLRAAAAWGEVDTVDDLADLYYQDDNTYHNDKLILAYTWNAAGDINVIYVMDAGMYTTYTVTLSQDLYEAGWTFADGSYVQYYADTQAPSNYVIVNKNFDTTGVNYGFAAAATIDKVAAATTAVVNGTNGLKLSVTGVPVYSTATSGHDYSIVLDVPNVAVDFAVDPALEDAYTISTKPVADYVYGEAIEVTITVKFDTNGNPITLTFDGPAANVPDAVFENIQTKDTGDTYQNITVTLYPVCGGTWTLTGSTWGDVIA